MKINTINFPLCTNPRKQNTPGYQLPINNHRHHPASSQQNLHLSNGHTDSYESFFPSISTSIGSNTKPRPYHLNDFANNHLFIAKCKLAPVFLGQPTKHLKSKNDLLHLFDQPEPKRKNRNPEKHRRQESTIDKTSSLEQNLHLSVVNLNVSPPNSSIQTRDRLPVGLIRPFEYWTGVKTYSST